MRAYLIDEIPSSEMKNVGKFFRENAVQSRLEQVFWIKIPDEILTSTQRVHRDCQPHVFAVELGSDWVKMEFFVRALKTLRCECQGYGTKAQRDYIISFAHFFIESLGLPT